MLDSLVDKSAEKSPDYGRKRFLVEPRTGSAVPGLAALTALMLVCSVIVAKTLAFMVDSLEARQEVAVSQALPQQASAQPSHRRALSDRFLRKGVDEIVTGSIRVPSDRR